MKSHQICKNCNFFQDNGPKSTGICKRYPPVICQQVIVAGNASVTEPIQELTWQSREDWCGEWRKAE